MKPEDVVSLLAPHLQRDQEDPRPVVVMMCGIAGAGKSTVTRALCSAHPPGTFERLSIDGIIASRHGLYGVDYPASMDVYAEFQSEADQIYDERLRTLLLQGDQNLILDRSFYARDARDDFKARIERAGARWVLVFFEVARDELWRRIQARRAKGLNADSALDISEDLFATYWSGFEAPDGEGEIRLRGD